MNIKIVLRHTNCIKYVISSFKELYIKNCYKNLVVSSWYNQLQHQQILRLETFPYFLQPMHKICRWSQNIQMITIQFASKVTFIRVTNSHWESLSISDERFLSNLVQKWQPNVDLVCKLKLNSELWHLVSGTPWVLSMLGNPRIGSPKGMPTFLSTATVFQNSDLTSNRVCAYILNRWIDLLSTHSYRRKRMKLWSSYRLML